MIKKTYPKKFFSVCDTLTCGQVFRYNYDKETDKYEVFSTDKHCYLSENEAETVVECNEADVS